MEAGLGLCSASMNLEYPFEAVGWRGLLRQEGLSCGRRHIATLMRRMGIGVTNAIQDIWYGLRGLENKCPTRCGLG